MRLRLHHPLWAHLPALAMIAAGTAMVLRSWPLSANLKMPGGQVEQLESPWGILVWFGFMLFFVGVSVAVDESWALTERKKTFNWGSLFDEVYVGFLLAAMWTRLDTLRHTGATVPSPTARILLVVGLGLAAAIALELLRPFRPKEEAVHSASAGPIAERLAEKIAAGQRWVYWDQQNPHWVNVVNILTGLLLLTGGLSAFGAAPGLGMLMCLLGLLVAAMVGGMRIAVTPEQVEVRLGVLGLRIFRVFLKDVQRVEVVDFAPVQEFGGWGPGRLGFGGDRKGVWGFFLSGNRGVEIHARSGRRYLIGSDNPEQLAKVIETALGRPSSAA